MAHQSPLAADFVPVAAAKILLQHIAVAHKDWLPSGALPLGHLNEAQAALHTLIGVSLLPVMLFCCTKL